MMGMGKRMWIILLSLASVSGVAQADSLQKIVRDRVIQPTRTKPSAPARELAKTRREDEVQRPSQFSKRLKDPKEKSRGRALTAISSFGSLGAGSGAAGGGGSTASQAVKGGASGVGKGTLRSSESSRSGDSSR